MYAYRETAAPTSHIIARTHDDIAREQAITRTTLSHIKHFLRGMKRWRLPGSGRECAERENHSTGRATENCGLFEGLAVRQTSGGQFRIRHSQYIFLTGISMMRTPGEACSPPVFPALPAIVAERQ
jgi:hypothetical protein